MTTRRMTSVARAESRTVDAEQRIRLLLERCFPADARVVGVPHQADVVFVVSWRLPTASGCRAKRSKTVRIAIDTDILNRYAGATRVVRRRFEVLLVETIIRALTGFDADHESAVNEDPPVVLWELDIVY